MAGITFTEGSGLQDSIFGKSQGPIRMFIEKRGEAFEAQSLVNKLFTVAPSKHYSEGHRSMTAMDGFMPVGENGAYPGDSMQESFKKDFEHMVWKDSFSISREIIDDEVMMNLKQRPEAFVAGYYRRREQFAAALYAGALGDKAKVKFCGREFEVTGADKKNLFAKDHPSFTNGKFVQSNIFKDEFSNDALMAMESAMQDFRDDNGNVLTVTPSTILIPNDYKLKKNVFAAIGADKDPATANNGFNYTYGRWTVIVSQYLNQYLAKGLKPWILLDPEYSAAYGGAVWYDRVSLEVRSEIAANDANVWKGYARFCAGFGDWRFAAAGGIGTGDQLISA